MKKIFLFSLIAVMGMYSSAEARGGGVMDDDGPIQPVPEQQVNCKYNFPNCLSCDEMGEFCVQCEAGYVRYTYSRGQCNSCPSGYTSSGFMGMSQDCMELFMNNATDEQVNNCLIQNGDCYPIQSNTPSSAPSSAPRIAANVTSANCTESVLDTTSGTSNLEANWTANTLNLEWYGANGKITPSNSEANTCTYDSGITVPSNVGTKTGYTFAGWKVKASGFNLSRLDAGIDGSSFSFITFGGFESTANDNGTRKVPSAHGITENGEWATEFSYVTVKGRSRCSTVGSGYAVGQNGNPTDNLNSGAYCWCQATGFDGDKDGIYEIDVSSLWTFYYSLTTTSNCASSCTAYCGNIVRTNENLRAGIFGSVTQ